MEIDRRLEALERLGRLLDEGKISGVEYETLKSSLVGETGQLPRADLVEPDARVSSDRFQSALDTQLEPDTPGWYPDPESEETHSRFFDGRHWTDSVRKRKSPGWYPDTEVSGRERYFNGLEHTYEYRKARSSSAVPNRSGTPAGDWRFWVGLILTVLGGLAFLTTPFASANGSLSLTVFLFNLAIHPLIWGGAFGVFLLRRWRKQSGQGPLRTIGYAIGYIARHRV